MASIVIPHIQVGSGGGGGGGATYPQYPGTLRVVRAAVAALAAGASANLDSSDITTGTTGQLISVAISGTGPFQGSLRTVTAGAPSPSVQDILSWDGNTEPFTFPDPRFVQVAAAATFTGFRIIVTNCDTTQAQDYYATFYYQEV